MGQPSPADVDVYDVGALIRVAATFVSTDLVTPADPSTIILQLWNSVSGVACYLFGVGGASITRVSAGAYYKDVTNDVYGADWRYRFTGTGGVQAVNRWQFISPPNTFVL